MSARVFALAAAATLAALGARADITRAEYRAPTDRYPHAVLGDDLEWGAIEITSSEEGPLLITLGKDLVFEDVAPRLVDLDGDGAREVIVVESHQQLGARLAVYDARGRIAATPHIGRRFRWLAPVGTADLDGDGRTEIAFVDRPHLAKTLTIYSWDAGTLVLRARIQGLTNHRIGEPDIAGGIRTCEGRPPAMILADGGWSRVLAVSWDGASFDLEDLGPHRGRETFRIALAKCDTDG